MRIEHIALWARNIETLKDFYVKYFGAHAGARYDNPAKHYSSYFLHFADGARLELMQRADVREHPSSDSGQPCFGYAHIAIAVGSESAVDTLTAQLAADGYTHLSGPRRTGDGYYESTVLDPDGNTIEITA